MKQYLSRVVATLVGITALLLVPGTAFAVTDPDRQDSTATGTAGTTGHAAANASSGAASSPAAAWTTVVVAAVLVASVIALAALAWRAATQRRGSQRARLGV